MKLERRERLWLLVCTVVGAALCFVPLFDLLAFEFAFSMGVVISFVGGMNGVHAARRNPEVSFRTWGSSTWRTVLVLMPALLLISLNGFRVRNCDYLEGMAFFFLFPVVTAVIASGWGCVSERLVPMAGRRIYGLVWGLVLLLAAWRFWVHPPVDLFSMFLGYYPGALYDEAFPIDGRLVWSRLEDLMLTTTAFVFATGERRSWWRRWQQPLSLVVAVSCLQLVVSWRAHDLAIYRDAAYVRSSLGGHTSTPNLEIFHPQGWSPQFMDRLTASLEFDHGELSEFLEMSPSKKISVYLYQDREMKKRLMGARRTRIAKPWQWAFHVDSPSVGHNVLIHEMAHIFSADIADRPHHLSLNEWGLPNMGVIEGFAEAAAWPDGQLNLHQWSAALKRTDLAPNLARLLRPDGFYKQYSRTAYTLCGSFGRWYRKKHGIKKLKASYRDGDFARPVQRPLDALEDEWTEFLSKIPLSTRAIEHTRSLFDRPAIFGKPCAREIAALRRDATKAIKGKSLNEALETYEEILGHIPLDASAMMHKIRLLYLMGDLNAAGQAVESGLEEAGYTESTLKWLSEWQADLKVLRGKPDGAAETYAGLALKSFNRPTLRRLTVKRKAVELGSPGQTVIDYLKRSMKPEQRATILDDLAQITGMEHLSQYLRGRTGIAEDRFEAGMLDLLQAAPNLQTPSLRIEAIRMAASGAFSSGCYALSAQLYDVVVEREGEDLSEGEIDSLNRWARRARFFAQYPRTQGKCALTDTTRLESIL